MADVRSVPLSLIRIGALARPVNPDRVAVLAASMETRGQLQPVGVRAVPGEANSYELVFGAHRFEAAAALGWAEIDVTIAHSQDDAGATLDRMSENLMRGELTALERAEHLCALKEAIIASGPKERRGRPSKNESKLLVISVADDIARRTGFDRFAVERAETILRGLPQALRARIHGSWLARNQAALIELASAEPALRDAAMEMLFPSDGEPKATSVGDALMLARGVTPEPVMLKRFKATHSNLVRMAREQREALFEQFEEEVRAVAQRKGWLG